MELIKWKSEKGYTLRMTWEEIESLQELLKIVKRTRVLPQETRHFRIEEV